VSSAVYVVDATVIDTIYANFSMAMDDVVVGQKNANMNDFTLFIVKKGEVPGFALFDKTQDFTLAGLLMGIPVKHVSVYFVNHLGETGAIDSEGRSATPKKRRIQILVRGSNQIISSGRIGVDLTLKFQAFGSQ